MIHALVEGRRVEFTDVAVPLPVYYGAAAGLVAGCGLYLAASTVTLVYVGVAIVALSALVLSYDYLVLRPGADRRFSYAIGGVWLYLVVLVLSVVSVLPVVFGVGVGGLPQVPILGHPIIRVVLLIGGLAVAVSVVRLRQEQGVGGGRSASEGRV